nr:uncharacterized protein LOC100179222 [Ciona intestinalis]|eukprot:XP_002129708.3 uncharacterized protein LOC100179222 [Ciona intestinalis]
MGCKENSRTQSCTVQVGQNPTQCRVPFRTTASHTPNRCTCCCDEDYCNQAFDNPCMEITELPECTPVPAPGNGTKSCTNPDDNLIPGTECWFECNSGFYAEGPTHTTCELNSARTGASFTNRGPRCIPLCPQNAVLDVVFAIEISTSASSVQTLKEITAAVIRKFSIGSTDTKIGVVGFRGNRVNPMVSNLKDRKTQPGLITFVNNLSFSPPGVGATPTLMSYINTNMFVATQGDRPNAGNVIVTMQSSSISVTKGGENTMIPVSSVYNTFRLVEAAIRK